jgi:hypothetical protein
MLDEQYRPFDARPPALLDQRQGCTIFRRLTGFLPAGVSYPLVSVKRSDCYRDTASPGSRKGRTRRFPLIRKAQLLWMSVSYVR